MYVYVCEPACMCTMCLQYPQKPEEDPDPLKLGLLVVVSLHMSVGNQTQVLWKGIKCS